MSVNSEPPAYVPPQRSNSIPRPVSVTSVGIPPVGLEPEQSAAVSGGRDVRSGTAHAALTIERGDAPGTEFRLTNEESTIGRWDADNGVFPDVDLDAFDADAKVSRRHARIVRRNGSYFIEDLGSTNGTYVNRGRRLLPGNSQPLNDGDEVIVGKTFLRFQITR
jgi:pSer/pThr/pTyr-binding forkhead associated (FHA) protein